MHRFFSTSCVLYLTVLVIGCSSDQIFIPDGLPLQTLTAVGYTYQRADGNRVVAGVGAFPDARPLDVSLSGTPQWVVAAPLPKGKGSIWAVALNDG